MQELPHRPEAVVFKGMTDLRHRSETVVLFFDIEGVRMAEFPRPIGRGPIEAWRHLSFRLVGSRCFRDQLVAAPLKLWLQP